MTGHQDSRDEVLRMLQGVVKSAYVLGIALLVGLSVSRLEANQGESAQYESALLVVLDVSGSMKESVEGGVKRELAQRGLLRTLENMPARAAIGLRLLGQGSTDDECTATATAVEFGPFARPEWEAALDDVRWDGATPLVYSMRAALSDLHKVNALRREMLIIGDGEETCGEDPVGIAREEAGDIPIHTISLGENVSPQLAGIALVTNGTYTRAFDETSFSEATTEAISQIPGPARVDLAGSTTSWLEVILDVSNSMWGQIDGRPKIELAREALSGALSDLPSNVAVGLRAYGHRVSVEDKEAGCTDTEQLLAPAPGNGPAIIGMAKGLTPRGQTPIARSLQESARDMREQGSGGVILLVSDGVESCGGDPVAVAAELSASGLDVVLHTVGLGVIAEEAAALSALAEAGGGRYFNAPSGAELLEGVGTAVRSSAEFVLQRDQLGSFPSYVARVRGGEIVSESEVIELGTYSFTEHMFREQRYFAVPGQPGEALILSGMVCALEIGRTRAGVITYINSTNMMMAEGVDSEGERVRRTTLLVRGDMGTWEETQIPVGNDGFARFRIGRTQGTVNRDMIFRLTR